MTGCRCAVAACNNSKEKTDRAGLQVSYHRFPKDKQLKQEWVQKCGRDEKMNPDTARVCSEHFTLEDFERNLKAELLQISFIRKLKSTAVPSLKLVSNAPDENQPLPTKTMQARASKETIKPLLVQSTETPKKPEYSLIEGRYVTCPCKKLLAENMELKKDSRVMNNVLSQQREETKKLQKEKQMKLAKQGTETAASSKNPKILPKVYSNKRSLVREESNESESKRQETETGCNFSYIDCSEASTSHTIFDTLWNAEAALKLPSRAWAVHYCSSLTTNTRLICISEHVVHGENTVERKKAILSENDLQYYVFGNFIKFDDLALNGNTNSVLRDLEYCLQEFHSKPLCAGGMQASEVPSNFKARNFYLDNKSSVWRHMKCTLYKNLQKTGPDHYTCIFCDDIQRAVKYFKYKFSETSSGTGLEMKTSEEQFNEESNDMPEMTSIESVKVKQEYDDKEEIIINEHNIKVEYTEIPKLETTVVKNENACEEEMGDNQSLNSATRMPEVQYVVVKTELEDIQKSGNIS